MKLIYLLKAKGFRFLAEIFIYGNQQLFGLNKILTLFVEEDKVTFCVVLGVCDSWKMVVWWWDGACDISPGVKHMEH